MYSSVKIQILQVCRVYEVITVIRMISCIHFMCDNGPLLTQHHFVPRV